MPNELDTQKALRALPAVDEILRCPELASLTSRAELTTAVRETLKSLRDEILAGRLNGDDPASLAVTKTIERLSQHRCRRLRPVINATGIVLHTGLGRAVLAEQAVDALTDVARGYSNLELDLDTGQRGKRGEYVKAQLCNISGAEASAIVNNNAAATLLVLNTLADGREAIVSRGHLIEIGGSFRLPDIMKKSGALLREVGTTNRTRVADYEAAIGDQTALLLHVHTSNYRIVGFTENASIADLSRLGHQHNLPVYDDLGSGALFDLTRIGLPDEPNVQESLRAGADVVSFSGDKLLGGPQVGIILGQKELIRKIEKNPLSRTYRVDKFTLAALEATLRLYDEPNQLTARLPVLRMLTTSVDTLQKRAERLAEGLANLVSPAAVTIESMETFAGGGSLPAQPIQTVAVIWKTRANQSEHLTAALRQGDPAVIARIHQGHIVFDCRTIDDDQISPIIQAVKSHLPLLKNQADDDRSQSE